MDSVLSKNIMIEQNPSSKENPITSASIDSFIIMFLQRSCIHQLINELMGLGMY